MGYTLIFGNGPISWINKMQGWMTKSSMLSIWLYLKLHVKPFGCENCWMRWRCKMMQPWSSPFCISSLNKTHWCCTSLHSWNSTRWQNWSCIHPNKGIDGICKQWNGWRKSLTIPCTKLWDKFGLVGVTKLENKDADS